MKTLNGSGVRGLTQEGLVIFLHELSLCTNQNVLVSMETLKQLLIFTSRATNTTVIFSYFPESLNDNSVPGLKGKIYDTERMSLKTPGSSSVVCFGTMVSFGETIIPNNTRKTLDL